MPAVIKEEPMDDVPDTPTKQETSFCDLVEIQPAQFGRIQYPPSCPIVRTIFGDGELPDVEFSTVTTAFLHFDTRDIVYKLQNGSIVAEKELHFGRGAPVWASLPEMRPDVAAVILHVVHPSPDERPVYSVQVEETKAVHHFVSSDSIKYRPHHGDDSLRCPGPKSMECPVGKKCTTDQLVASEASSLQNEEDSAQELGASSLSSSPPRRISLSLRGERTLSTEAVDKEMATKPAAKIQHEGLSCPLRAARPTSDDEGEKQSIPCKRLLVASNSSDASPSPPKRQRMESQDREDVFHCSLVFPIWTPTSIVSGCLSDANRGRLEKQLKCKLSLRGRAVERKPPKPVKLYLDIAAAPDLIDPAIERIEETVLASQGNLVAKRLMMHDIAKDNSDFYRHNDGIVYQRDAILIGRDSQPWRWMSVLNMPLAWDADQAQRLLIGPRKRGIHEMVGETECEAMVISSPRGCIFISGKSVKQVRECVERARDRITWARERFKHNHSEASDSS